MDTSGVSVREEREVVTAHGHPLISSTHKSTFEVTKDEHLTERGDCIIAVGADKGAVDLNPAFKKLARRNGSEITITIRVDGLEETIKARGSRRLTFTDPKDLVVRKSRYTCGRTIAIEADKAAVDLSRSLVERLKNPEQRVEVILTVRVRSV